MALVVGFQARVAAWLKRLAASSRADTHPLWWGLWLLTQIFGLLPSALQWLFLGVIGLVRAAPAVAWLALPFLVAAVGAAGRIRDHAVALEGVGGAGLEARSGFVHAGLFLGAELAGASLQLAGLLFLLMAFCAAAGHFLASGHSPSGNLRLASLLAGIGVVGGLFSALLLLVAGDTSYLDMGGAWLLPLASCGGGVALAWASWRTPDASVDQAEAAVATRGRLLVASCIGLSVTALWVGMTMEAWSELHKAFSAASPEVVADLVARALAVRPGPTGSGVVAVLVAIALLAITFTQKPMSSIGSRSVVSAVAAGLCLIGTAALHLFGLAGVGVVAQHTDEKLMLDLVERVPTLPTRSLPESKRGQGFDEALAWVDGAWVSAGTAEIQRSPAEQTQSPRTILVGIDPQADANALLMEPLTSAESPSVAVIKVLVDGPANDVGASSVPLVRVANSRGVEFVIDHPATDELSRIEAEDMTDVEDVLQARPWFYVSGTRQAPSLHRLLVEPSPISGTDDLRIALEIGVPGSGRAIEQLIFVPGEDWTIDYLLEMCLSVQTATAEWDQRVRCGLATAVPEISIKRVPEPKAPVSASTAPSGPAVNVRLDCETMTNQTERTAVSTGMKKYVSRCRQCYQDQLRHNPGLSGQVEVIFDVTGGGRVSGVTTMANSTGNAALGACLEGVMRRVRLQQIEEDLEVECAISMAPQ